jgi:adenosyl cobinamide kinase/adenosyl cobinamide phosphate guanylyltransferase
MGYTALPRFRLFVATCEPDAEMEARIAAHQRERGSD